MRDWIEEQFRENVRVQQEALASLAGPLEAVIRLTIDAMAAGRKLVLFGNGGSAADCQHIACEFVERIKHAEVALPALALTTDSSLLTAIPNDRGFDQLFARQIQALCQAGDIALAFSTSGNSPNILEGLKAARDRGLSTVAFLGKGGGHAAPMADHALIVPSRSPQRIQECHILMGHILAESVEDHFAGLNSGR